MDDVPSFFLMLGAAAFCAGFVDAVVGGGGLVQIPALFTAYPQLPPAALLGTNKLSSIVGTTSAAVQYGRRVVIPWRIALPGAIAALISSWYGAKTVVLLSPTVLRPLVLVLLILVALYTFLHKDLGATSRELSYDRRSIATVVAIGGIVGFYDGFFGPGTGSFLIFLFIRFLGMDFLRASVTAKILNASTNLVAIIFLARHTQLLWQLGGVMAACNLTGALVGSRMALKHGVCFVRKMFLCVVTALIAKLAYDTMFG